MGDLLDILESGKNIAEGSMLMQGIGDIVISNLFAVANDYILTHGD